MKTYSQHVRVNDYGVPELCPFDYLDFYEVHAHPYHEFMFEEGREKVYEGITARDFHLRHKEGFWHIVQPILQDKRLEQLQDELEEEGKQVCMFNMYILAMFLVEKSKSRYLFLLKPTISETLSALKDVSKITFINKDGSTVESSSSILIKMEDELSTVEPSLLIKVIFETSFKADNVSDIVGFSKNKYLDLLFSTRNIAKMYMLNMHTCLPSSSSSSCSCSSRLSCKIGCTICQKPSLCRK